MGLKILVPEPATFTGGGTGVANLATASPREVWATPNLLAPRRAFIDLGEARTVDHLFVGAWTALATSTVQLLRCTGPDGAGGVEVVARRPLLLPGAEKDRTRHAVVAFPPVASRWWEVNVLTDDGSTIGRMIFASAFEHATSLGGGRLLVDPAPRQAFADGGFGIGDGTVKRIVRWRFEDLTDDDVERLERLGEDRGTSRPLVVVEHRPGGPRALDVHYGLFGTFEANERADPKETRWAFSLEEWR